MRKVGGKPQDADAEEVVSAGVCWSEAFDLHLDVVVVLIEPVLHSCFRTAELALGAPTATIPEVDVLLLDAQDTVALLFAFEPVTDLCVVQSIDALTRNHAEDVVDAISGEQCNIVLVSLSADEF